MPEVSDVELMELADGTLAEPRRRAIEAELGRDADLRDRLEAFLATGKALARLFDPVVEAPVPPALVDTVLGTGRSPPQRRLHRETAPGVLAFPKRHRHDPPRHGWRLSSQAALAAGVVCAVAVAGALWTTRAPHGRTHIAEASVALALEKTPSAKTASVQRAAAGTGVLRPDLSFRHEDGRFCRQYVLTLDSGQAFAGFACNMGKGRWQIETESETAAVKPETPGAIRPAGADETARTVEEAIDQVMLGDALETETERRLIDNGWAVDGSSQ